MDKAGVYIVAYNLILFRPPTLIFPNCDVVCLPLHRLFFKIQILILLKEYNKFGLLFKNKFHFTDHSSNSNQNWSIFRDFFSDFIETIQF